MAKVSQKVAKIDLKPILGYSRLLSKITGASTILNPS